MKRLVHLLLAIMWLLVQGGASANAEPKALEASGVAPPTLKQFQSRVDHSRQGLAQVAAAAEAGAKRTVDHPDALITANYGKQASFAEEMMNRSGCLSNCLDEWARRKQATPNDIFLFSVRAWEADGIKNIAELAQAKKQGWMVVLFASEAGMPQEARDVGVDYLIDNGAATGAESEGSMNTIANVTNAWLWVCEYTAAMTRRGKHPGILQSILTAGHEEHNGRINGSTTRSRQFNWDQPIESGKLAGLYLDRVEKLILDLAGVRCQSQIDRAATLIAEQIGRGGRVCATHATHILTQEINLDTPVPVHAFNVIWRAKTAFKEHVKPDDLVIFFSFMGLNTPLEDYATPLRETKARFITCHLKDENQGNNAPDAAAHIDACWTQPDAEVPIAFPPHGMAPVSSLNQILVYRMLLHAAAEKLKPQEP